MRQVGGADVGGGGLRQDGLDRRQRRAALQVGGIAHATVARGPALAATAEPKERGPGSQVEVQSMRPCPMVPNTQLPAAYWSPISTLRKWAKNPGKNDHAVPRVARSIRKYGFVA